MVESRGAIQANSDTAHFFTGSAVFVAFTGEALALTGAATLLAGAPFLVGRSTAFSWSCLPHCWQMPDRLGHLLWHTRNLANRSSSFLCCCGSLSVVHWCCRFGFGCQLLRQLLHSFVKTARLFHVTVGLLRLLLCIDFLGKRSCGGLAL